MKQNITELNETLDSLKESYKEYIKTNIDKYHNSTLCKMIGAKSDNQLLNTLHRGKIDTLKKWANIIYEKVENNG